MDSSAVCQTFWRHGFTLRRNAFIAKENVGEDGVGYGTEVSRNRRPDRLVFVDGFAMNRLTMGRGDGAQPGSFICRMPSVCFHCPTFPGAMLLWLFHISCPFPRRDPAQKIIYIQLGSLMDFEMSRTLPPYKTRLPPQIKRYEGVRLPPLASVPSSPDFSHCPWAPLIHIQLLPRCWAPHAKQKYCMHFFKNEPPNYKRMYVITLLDLGE